MGLFGWFFGSNEQGGNARAAFDHRKIYDEVQNGPGISPASQAAGEWQQRVSKAFEEAHSELEAVLKDSQVAMRGAAGDRMRKSVEPLKKATDESIQVSKQVGSVVEGQAQGSADFKNSFPKPYDVPSANIGWSDYLSPTSYALKSGVHAAHEQQRDEVEAEARRQYESYTQASNDRVSGIQRFSPVPSFSGDVRAAEANPVGRIDPSMSGGGSGGGSGVGSGGTYRTSDGFGSAAGAGGSGTGGVGSGTGSAGSSVPPAAGSGSAWTPPPSTGGPAPTPTPAPGSGGGPGGGSGGGVGVVGGPDGSGGGRGGPGTGGRAGSGSGVRGGSGPRGGYGAGSGTGSGRGTLGPGGRAGVGSFGSGGTSSGAAGGASAARGGSAMGPAGAGRGAGRNGEEDAEHETKYVLPTDEAWEDLGIPRTAPAVIGGDLEPPRDSSDEQRR
ncbi:hypothetical protein [Actinopolyspora mortivallis]|uniref:PPE family domain-containing protein n=1 Tax=Actinopolyspora mortivallis TaxID=33906 RepID=A0A2T0GZB4_ACTMO|nr:hypothetical protein [Actinopolyspora mortivallis]PRW64455.1 hypothetical protein CEP50_05110 [Actinopolyspora mortivallis]